MSTKIEWCDETINPIQDVRKGKSGRGYHCTKRSPGCLNCYAERINKIRGNGLPFDNAPVEFELIQSELDKPFKWKKPRSIFVQSMGDLFHRDMPDEFIDAVWLMISKCPQHTFLILTKRRERMTYFMSEIGVFNYGVLPNAYLGLTVCNQQEWNDKGELFLQIPGKKFISHEPALERIDYGPGLKEISCLLSGGETGPGARPSHPDIFRADRDQCEAAGVDFFFKGWGEWLPADQWDEEMDIKGQINPIDNQPVPLLSARVGKKKAGRILDGRTHDDLPWYKPEDIWKVGG